MSHRIIFHIDLNSFYASVEAADDSSLKGKPLAIAGNAKKRKGIVVTASYEAKRKGIKPPVPLWEAKRACPDLIVREPRFFRYREMSARFFEILRTKTELVEPVSIDEGYLDMTDSLNEQHPIAAAEAIQQQILDELDLPCSIGIGPNKFLAKTASDWKKPLGITVLRKRDVQQLLWPLSCEEMHGIGARTAEKLKQLDIETIGDIAACGEKKLKDAFGTSGERMFQKAWGIDKRQVDPEAAEEFKSIGNSRTLPEDAVSLEDMKPVMHLLASLVAERLHKKHVYASGLQLTIRYSTWETVQRSTRLPYPLSDHKTIETYANELLETYWNGGRVRLLGLTGIDLIEKGNAVKQLDLFSYEQDKNEWDKDEHVRKLQDRFGASVVRRGYY
ncbi:DNA polymerase IV [Alkalicoccus luteus]|uniref:DNA polymerase IV n=1 Tax=Alkalicoccus luteus TaxID=1237094 RepID=A0A969PQY9_9BACI|nr:DNA polymerase IV [Alkalicoccus luteus]NJP38801.1 DNA polymerase IV [Alkalicoccus luteus]